jgi:hypothetical protein
LFSLAITARSRRPASCALFMGVGAAWRTGSNLQQGVRRGGNTLVLSVE